MLEQVMKQKWKAGVRGGWWHCRRRGTNVIREMEHGTPKKVWKGNLRTGERRREKRFKRENMDKLTISDFTSRTWGFRSSWRMVSSLASRTRLIVDIGTITKECGKVNYGNEFFSTPAFKYNALDYFEWCHTSRIHWKLRQTFGGLSDQMHWLYSDMRLSDQRVDPATTKSQKKKKRSPAFLSTCCRFFDML